ncbi:hypothetical protein BBK36DRAFT_1160991 [Trichoderma citrinoviride]|uniref:Uncharacterized protein n=1 Tax=Trichoderma citrinoviride TaxID=58853 RepID=A0A2T4B696_9HYPO|nr:hypothetical protein BBK36DRAFT_1160991 [Trichoderma citrinoviride]PTB64830.1 hypothetical protein BBK36DRAFT_1160991 [Trichoderma citrinoviride]
MDLETLAIAEGSGAELPRDVSPSSSPSSCRTYSLDSRSAVSTKPSSRGSSPATKKENNNGARGRSRRSSQPATPSWNILFHPRSYEEIYAERAYLTASLQAYSLRAIEMIHQYSLIEEELQARDHVGKERRKLRKQMSFIKVKLSEASRQEKAIVLRLSELHMEQLGRDAWDQVQQRRAFYSKFSPRTAKPSSRSPEKPLSADSKEFVPSATQLDSSPARAHSCASELESRTLDTVDEGNEGEENDGERLDEPGTPEAEEAEIRSRGDSRGDELCNHGLEYTYRSCDKTPESQLRPLDTRQKLSARSEDRRKSLPSLCSVWPDAKDHA